MQINNRKFKRTLLKLNSILGQYPKWALLGFLLLITISMVQLTKLKSLYDLNDLVDSDFKTYTGLQMLNTEFDEKNQLQFILVQPDWTEQELCATRKIITQFYIENTDIKRLNSTFGIKKFTESDQRIDTEDLLKLNCDKPTTENKNSELQKIKSTPWNKIFNSTNSLDLIIQMSIADNDVGGRFGEFNPEIVDALKQNFQKKLTEQNLKTELKLSGLVAFKYHLKKGYQLLQAMNGLSLLICIFIFWFFYRSAKASFIFISSVVLTIIIVYGGMATAGHSIDMLSNALPLMLTMSCLEDFIFFCHFRSHGYSFKKTLHKIILPSFLTSLTTAIGFGSLMFSELSIIRRFGIWAAVGSLTEWIILFLIFPAILKIYPKLNFTVEHRIFTNFNLQITHRFTKAIKWLAFLIIPLSLWATTQLHIDDSPENLFPKNHPIQQTIEWLKENKGWTTEFSILTDRAHAILQEKIDKTLSERTDVVVYESPLKTQNYLAQNLSLPFQSTVKKLWTDSRASQRLISENGISRQIVYINNPGVEAVSEITQFLNQKLCTTNDLNTCIVAGSAVSYSEFGSRILRTLLESLLVSLILVALVIFLFRTTDLKTTFYLILSSIWGPLALITFFGIFKISIFYVTSICASLLVGLAGDNAIQFMYFSKRISKSVDFLQDASFKIMLGMMLMCLILFLAPFTPLIHLGWIFILSFILLYIGDVVILKAFLWNSK